MAKNNKASTKQEATPGPYDYAKAIWSLSIIWLSKRRKLLYFSLISLLALAGWVAVATLQDRSELTNDEVVTLVNQRLGLNESNPAVLEVVDDSKVSQPFLEDAVNGDKILLYYQAEKSILFRPDGEQIIREGVYTPPEAKVFIRDSENDQNAVNELIGKLDSVEGIEVVSRDTTAKSYNNISVVSVTDRYPEEAQAVADKLGGEITRLPSDESIPDADILVIFGR